MSIGSLYSYNLILRFFLKIKIKGYKMKIALKTKKFKLNQALEMLSYDKHLTASFSFDIKSKAFFDGDKKTIVKVSIPKELKKLFKDENSFNQFKIKIFMKQFRISTKNKNPSSDKKHIHYNSKDEKLGFMIKNGKVRIDEDNKVYFETKAGKKLLEELNFKNLKKFLKVFAHEIEVLGEFQF